VAGGAIAKIRDGDIVAIDAEAGTLDVRADLAARPLATLAPSRNEEGWGRELFALFRAHASAPEEGATILPRAAT
jgi:phosphogluconate dehydratase